MIFEASIKVSERTFARAKQILTRSYSYYEGNLIESNRWKPKCNRTEHVTQNPRVLQTETAHHLIEENYAFLTSENKAIFSDWLLDSGATCHMSNNKSLFDTTTFIQHSSLIGTANKPLESKGCGNIEMELKDSKGNNKLFKLVSVLFVPDINFNIISEKKLAEENYKIIKEKNGCTIKKNKKTLFISPNLGTNLHVLKQNSKTVSFTIDINEAHKCLGHVNFDQLTKMRQTYENSGLKLSGTAKECEICKT